jgi:Ankyrin repeats (3 copies)
MKFLRPSWPIIPVAGLFAVVIVVVVLYRWGHLGGAPSRQNQLFVAIWRDETNTVEKLLAEGADPNGSSNQINKPTPLIDATRFGRLTIVELLLNKGADPNKADRNGFAALYYALDSPYLGGPNDVVSAQIVKILIAHGAVISGKGVANAMRNLPSDDPRLRVCQEALASKTIQR